VPQILGYATISLIILANMGGTNIQARLAIADQPSPLAERMSAREVSAVMPTAPALDLANVQEDDAHPLPLLGQWSTPLYGEQIVTHNPDGTATLDMKLNRIAAIMFGKEVNVELEWSVEGDVITQKIVGGSPASSIEKLKGRYGDAFTYRIIEQSVDQLILAEISDPDDVVQWNRVVQ